MLEIGNKLRENGYLSNSYINFAVMSAINGVPLLVEGDPGVGKTSLAYATAKMLDLELLRVQFYDGLSYDKILYDYDYQKQLLTIQAIQGTIKESLAGKDLQESLDAAGKINFYGRDFLIERPILKAISGKKRYVLLLDEVEKASEEIEYTLLEVLENFSISIPQYGTVTCPEEMRPIVFLTSNRYRDPAKHIAHDKVCALAAYAGQGEQLFKGGGHLTTVFIAQHPHTGGDIPRFGVSQPAGLDDGFNVFGFCSSQRSNIGIFGKQVFHHNVHAGIGALGCQTHADQKLPGVVIIQCTAGIWVFFF